MKSGAGGVPAERRGQMPNDVETIRVSEPLQVERVEDGRRKLLRNLVIHLDRNLGVDEPPGFLVARHRKAGIDVTQVTVPTNFKTDFSSIPRFARGMYRFDSVDLAGCCHDYAYFIGIPRKQADEIWRLVAISGKPQVKGWKGRLGYLALRLGGKRAYKGHAKKRAERERNADTIDLTTGALIDLTADSEVVDLTP